MLERALPVEKQHLDRNFAEGDAQQVAWERAFQSDGRKRAEKKESAAAKRKLVQRKGKKDDLVYEPPKTDAVMGADIRDEDEVWYVARDEETLTQICERPPQTHTRHSVSRVER